MLAKYNLFTATIIMVTMMNDDVDDNDDKTKTGRTTNLISPENDCMRQIEPVRSLYLLSDSGRRYGDQTGSPVANVCLR